ncbi:MAG: DUF3658 domain-containing protein [Chitinophagaceae bacterium]
MIHIIVGDMAAENLRQAFEIDENLKGEILVLKDTLGIGPLKPDENQFYDAMRSQYWQTLLQDETVQLDEESRLKNTIDLALQEEEPMCLWMAPCISDVMAYYWLLPYFKPYPGVLHTIAINGLPFFNEKGQLFYPTNFSQVLPTEFIKTKRLLKEISIAEFETETDEWYKLQQENTGLRVHEGSKSVLSKPLSHFDYLIKNSLNNEFQKASKVINETLKKSTQTIADTFFIWRLRTLIQEQEITCKGDYTKTTKDFEVRKINTTETIETQEESKAL